MGKKGAKKGKKGKGDGGYEIKYGKPGDPTSSKLEEIAYLEALKKSLERALVMKMEYADTAKTREMELREQVETLEQDYKKEQSTTFAVTADMARQYKALQDDLIHKINSLETTLTEQKEEYDMTQHELRELVADKDSEIELRDQAITELKQRMEDMSTEFASMLNQTLRLMKEHTEAKLSGEGFEEKTDYAQRLQEYSQKAYAAVTATPS
jgi:hypothetical protein